MKSQNKRNNPETVTTFRFLNEHLYQVALRGGYQDELEKVKTALPTLQRFNSAGELLKAMRRDTEFRAKTFSELETLWQENYDLRPATGIILMLLQMIAVFFRDLAKARGEPLAEALPAGKRLVGEELE